MLILDPEEDFREALGQNLRDDGHPVREHGELPRPGGLPGLEALLANLQGPWVLVAAPDVLGPRTADLVRAVRPELPVLLLGILSAGELSPQAAAHPRLGLAAKPARYEDVHRLIHELAATPLPSLRVPD